MMRSAMARRSIAIESAWRTRTSRSGLVPFGPCTKGAFARWSICRKISRVVGETAKAPDFTMAIENVKECKVPYYFKAKKGNIKLGVEVQIEGSADKDVPVNPFYAKVTDGDGYSYTSTFGGCDPELKSVRVNKGEKAKGWITFEVPQKASNLKLTYNPFIVSTVKQEVKFDLGR